MDKVSNSVSQSSQHQYVIDLRNNQSQAVQVSIQASLDVTKSSTAATADTVEISADAKAKLNKALHNIVNGEKSAAEAVSDGSIERQIEKLQEQIQALMREIQQLRNKEDEASIAQLKALESQLLALNMQLMALYNQKIEQAE